MNNESKENWELIGKLLADGFIETVNRADEKEREEIKKSAEKLLEEIENDKIARLFGKCVFDYIENYDND